eukprot:2685607-Prymnesium_polylepis.1
MVAEAAAAAAIAGVATDDPGYRLVRVNASKRARGDALHWNSPSLTYPRLNRKEGDEEREEGG